MKEPLRCEYVTWHQTCRLVRRLALLLAEADFQPETVVAIARGGYVPARVLCDYLSITALTDIRIEHYLAGAAKQPQARLVAPLSVPVKGKRVLIVDDVSDSGDTLEVALAHLDGFDPAAVKTAVLHHKTVSRVQPDFYAARIIKWRWLVYPWAVIEDVCGFLDAMAAPPRNAAEARQRLASAHGLNLSQAIVEDALRFRPLSPSEGLNR